MVSGAIMLAFLPLVLSREERAFQYILTHTTPGDPESILKTLTSGTGLFSEHFPPTVLGSHCGYSTVITAIAEVTRGFEDDTVRKRHTYLLLRHARLGTTYLWFCCLTLLVSCCLLLSAPCWLNIAQTASNLLYNVQAMVYAHSDVMRRTDGGVKVHTQNNEYQRGE
uniref:Uncharacterized protein n=1 Tax=Oncorhynchus tshawytscha TaxID=74940 RepID=A0A8C8J1U3_ONCTS